MRNAADGTWTGGPIVHPLFIVVGRVRQSRTVTPGGLTAARDARAADPDVTSLRPISSDKDETDGPPAESEEVLRRDALVRNCARVATA